MMALISGLPSARSPVRAVTVTTDVRSVPELVMNAFAPLIVHWPGGLKAKKGSFIRTPGHLIDIMTTCVDLAGVKYPEKRRARTLIPMEGTSLLPLFENRPDDYRPHEAIYWEHTENRAVRKGKWKLVSVQKGEWELYDMQADRAETNNLTGKHPEIVGKLARMYKHWAARAMVNR